MGVNFSLMPTMGRHWPCGSSKASSNEGKSKQSNSNGLSIKEISEKDKFKSLADECPEHGLTDNSKLMDEVLDRLETKRNSLDSADIFVINDLMSTFSRFSKLGLQRPEERVEATFNVFKAFKKFRCAVDDASDKEKNHTKGYLVYKVAKNVISSYRPLRQPSKVMTAERRFRWIFKECADDVKKLPLPTSESAEDEFNFIVREIAEIILDWPEHYPIRELEEAEFRRRLPETYSAQTVTVPTPQQLPSASAPGMPGCTTLGIIGVTIVILGGLFALRCLRKRKHRDVPETNAYEDVEELV